MQSIQAFFDSLHPSIEPQKLAEFVEIARGERVFEIGCGNGYMALYLAWRFPDCGGIHAIDLSSQQIEEAYQAYDALCGMSERRPAPVRFEIMDARALPLPDDPFDVCVCNPPFFSHQASRLSPDPERRQARSDETLTLLDLFDALDRVLKSNGRAYLVFPWNRMKELSQQADNQGLALVQREHLTEIRKRSGGVCLVKLERKR